MAHGQHEPWQQAVTPKPSATVLVISPSDRWRKWSLGKGSHSYKVIVSGEAERSGSLLLGVPSSPLHCLVPTEVCSTSRLLSPYFGCQGPGEKTGTRLITGASPQRKTAVWLVAWAWACLQYGGEGHAESSSECPPMPVGHWAPAVRDRAFQGAEQMQIKNRQMIFPLIRLSEP